jgi:hypothetical protein
LARAAGFTHAYVVLDWESTQPVPGSFAWEFGLDSDLDHFLTAARANGLQLIVRLDVRLDRRASRIGRPGNIQPAELEAFASGVAARARGIAAAYEIFNEPNLYYEWGGPPNPAAYARLLAAAARGIRRADPDALVISAGLAPHTGGYGGNMEDVDFLRGMYAAGARGTFDVLGIHPYGGNTSPDRNPNGCGICFRRAELYRQVMVEHGDGDTPVWITEFGYLHTTTVDLGQYNWLKLSPQQQAANLVGAFQYAYRHWPWLSGMVVFNLDFSTVPWTPPYMGAYWFSLLNPDRTPRPAYFALRDMAKPGAGVVPRRPPAPGG